MQGGERAEYYKTLNTQAYKVTMRYSDIRTTDVIRYGVREFEIQAITNPLENNYYLECLCIEKGGKRQRSDRDEPEIQS